MRERGLLNDIINFEHVQTHSGYFRQSIYDAKFC